MPEALFYYLTSMCVSTAAPALIYCLTSMRVLIRDSLSKIAVEQHDHKCKIVAAKFKVPARLDDTTVKLRIAGIILCVPSGKRQIK